MFYLNFVVIVVVVADNVSPIFSWVRCLKSVSEVENRFGGRVDMPSLDVSCRIVDPRERGFVSSLTVLAPINGTMVPWERLMGAHMTLDVS